MRGWHPALRGMVEGSPEELLYVEPLQDLGGWAGQAGAGRATLRTHAGAGERSAKGLAAALGPQPLPPAQGAPSQGTAAGRGHVRRRVPLSLVREAREMLPSATGGGREARHTKREAQRERRWRELRSGRSPKL
eukprot:gene41841-4276_t